ncbi:MAG: aldehyde dehydrogenase family protein [Planctomycetota bacterium]|nr:aldehyde dehydrogenase family protein [Planctomycetota bacterium]MDA1177724.1 aldehyde dehydrogenase family protein [Planctomycetota bacterium]
MNRAISCANADVDGWRQATPQFRREVLDRVAQQIAEQRGDLIGAALAETGKLVPESDPEVSEAIDFVRFYARTAEHFYSLTTLKTCGTGVVAVVSPWNFPLAIPCGGIAAALAAGNCVILKPASNATLVAYKLCECFWQAGISRHTLQFLPCAGKDTAQKLVTHSGIQAVVLTGGTATALSMLNRSPRLNLIAETGGKNATIVTAMSDRDQAIKNVVHSAFSHSGQKCSATSLLILEQEVYDDATFRDTLCDAVASRAVGSAWELATNIGPLIHAPAGPLERGLKELEHGESWALLPRISEQNRQLVSPGIKWGVRPGSYTHITEFFGPLLAVMPARNLREAITLSHQTGYGLTAGLESLDDREQQLWQELTLAGNLYVNRPTTGAIVLRQPFGGWAKSAFGPGLKAGGPNYVVSLMNFQSATGFHQASPLVNTELAILAAELLRPHRTVARIPVTERRNVVEALSSYDQMSKTEFGGRHDFCRILGQDNFMGYRSFREVRVRLDRADTFFDIISRVGAARSLGCRTTISTPLEFDCPALQFLDEITQPWGAHVELVEETDEQLADVLLNGQIDRLRYSSQATVPESILRAAAQASVYVARAPVLPEGRVELLWYLREQSVSTNYHRYGNLGIRSTELRRERS